MYAYVHEHLSVLVLFGFVCVCVCVEGWGEGRGLARRDKSDRYWSSLFQLSKGLSSPCALGRVLPAPRGREGQPQSMSVPPLGATGSVWIYLYFFLFWLTAVSKCTSNVIKKHPPVNFHFMFFSCTLQKQWKQQRQIEQQKAKIQTENSHGFTLTLITHNNISAIIGLVERVLKWRTGGATVTVFIREGCIPQSFHWAVSLPLLLPQTNWFARVRS